MLVRHGDALGVHDSAGAEHPPGVPRWPPDDVPVLERRRIPEDRRLDRTDADPPIAWRVDVQVESRATDYGTLDDLVARRAELEVAAAAARIEVLAGWRAEPAAVPLA